MSKSLELRVILTLIYLTGAFVSQRYLDELNLVLIVRTTGLHSCMYV